MTDDHKRLLESLLRRPIRFKDGLGIFLFGVTVGMLIMAMLT